MMKIAQGDFTSEKRIITAVTVMFVAFIVTQPLNAKADWRQTAKGNYYYISNGEN